jgi:hypothetical protein
MAEDFKLTRSPQAMLSQRIREVHEWNVFSLRLNISTDDMLSRASREEILWSGAILVSALKSVYGV